MSCALLARLFALRVALGPWRRWTRHATMYAIGGKVGHGIVDGKWGLRPNQRHYRVTGPAMASQSFVRSRDAKATSAIDRERRVTTR